MTMLEAVFCFFFLIFVYLWLCWVFVAAVGLSLCGERGVVFLAVNSLPIRVGLLVAARGPGARTQ